MIIVGIDVAKNKHDAIIIDSKGDTLTKSFRIPNSHKGANTLIDRIKNINNNNLTVINPIQSDSFRNMYIRQTKNDSVDAFIIAEVIRFSRFSTTSLAEGDILALRNLSHFRLFLVDTVADLKRKTISLLDQVFPEYSSLFSDIFGKSSLELLSFSSTPEEILAMDTEHLISILSSASKGHLGSHKAHEIKAAATESFGIKLALDSFSFEIKQLIEQIKSIENQITELEKHIQILLKKLNTLIQTLPEVDPVLGNIILSEIGNITRFKNASKLVAFAGISPSVKQSGEFIATHNKMSKRGSPYLRRAIFLATQVAAFNDPVLSAYYQKKSTEGKHHYTAIGAVARKLMYITFAVLTRNQPYTPIA